MPTALLKPAKPRAQIIDDVSGLRVTIPARRNWFLVAFLPAWLVGWAVGEVAVLGKLVTDPPDAGEGLFLFVWLVLWSIAGVLFIFFWLWNLAGKEIVALDEEALTVRYALGPSGWTRRFDRREVRDLRVSASGMTDFRSSIGWWLGGFGTISFDYGARTYRFGRGVDEAEAKQIVAELQLRLEPPEPF
jgi:hypothetical protein